MFFIKTFLKIDVCDCISVNNDWFHLSSDPRGPTHLFYWQEGGGGSERLFGVWNFGQKRFFWVYEKRRDFLGHRKNRDFPGYCTFHQLNKWMQTCVIYCWCGIFLGRQILKLGVFWVYKIIWTSGQTPLSLKYLSDVRGLQTYSWWLIDISRNIYLRVKGCITMK